MVEEGAGKGTWWRREQVKGPGGGGSMQVKGPGGGGSIIVKYINLSIH